MINLLKDLHDFGHGGKDGGACYNGRKESNDVLLLGNRVCEILSANNIPSDKTRTGNDTVSLKERSAMCNKGDYEYFISYHRNAIAPEKAKGVEVHVYNSGCTKAYALAKKINDNLVSVGFTDRGVKFSNFHVLRESNTSAVLIECGFVDNTIDNELFDGKFEEIAQAIAKAIMECKGISGADVPTPTPKPQAPKPIVNNTIATLQKECNAQGFSKQVVDGIAGKNTLLGCPTLKKGSQGNITKCMQTLLGGIVVDGVFGNLTYNRVIQFQKQKGLLADGIVGKNTWRKLLGL